MFKVCVYMCRLRNPINNSEDKHVYCVLVVKRLLRFHSLLYFFTRKTVGKIGIMDVQITILNVLLGSV